MEETRPASETGKVLRFPGKIFKVLRGEPIVPTLVEVHPTQLCNQSCPHCVGDDPGKERGRDAMIFEDFRARIHDPYESLALRNEETVRRLSFSGETGDPLVAPDFLRMAEYARIPFILVTNGTGRIDPVLLKAQGIRISLDATTGEDYGKRHGLASGARSFQRVLDHARALLRWRLERGASTSIGFGYLTRTDTTIAELEAAVALAEEVGVDYVNFRPLHGTHAPLPPEAAALGKGRRTHVILADKYRRMESGAPPADGSCYATRFLMVVAADLQAYSCCHFTGRTDYALGSLRTRRLGELVREATRQAGRYPNPLCVAHCRGHRINADVSEVGRLRTFDPYL